MATTYLEWPSVAPNTPLNISIEYDPDRQDEIVVLVDGVITDKFTWTSPTQITTDADFPTNSVTRVERRTSVDEFSLMEDTGVFDYEGYNQNMVKSFYSLQEFSNLRASIVGVDDTIEAFNATIATFNTNLASFNAVWGGGILAVAYGGTGANDPASARTALGVPGLAAVNTFTSPQLVSLTTGSTSGDYNAYLGAGFRTSSYAPGLALNDIGSGRKSAHIGVQNDVLSVWKYDATGPASHYKVLSLDLNTGELTGCTIDNILAAKSVGSIGSYGFFKYSVAPGPTVHPGGTVAGSVLQYTSSRDDIPSPGTTSPSGTWRCMGYVPASTTSGLVSLYMRIA